MRRNSLYFVPIIKNLHREYGFVSIIVYGPQGSGKTTFAIKTAAAVYGSYQKALQHLFFNLNNFVTTLEHYFNNNERVPIIILDDAALELHRQQYRQNITMLFEKIYNLARTVATCFIFTTVDVGDLLRGLRNKFMYRVSMHKLSHYKALGKIYRFTITPQLQPIIKLVGYQLIKLNLPNSFWQDYEVKRRAAVRQLFHQFKHAVARTHSKKRKALDLDQALEQVANEWGLDVLDSVLSG